MTDASSRSWVSASRLVVLRLSMLLLVCNSSVAVASVVFAGRLDNPANAALVASDFGAASFGTSAQIANNVAILPFLVTLGGSVEVSSSGFGVGGVDPYFTLFAGTGNPATFLASNYLQAFSTGGDFDVFFGLAPGSYTIALGAYANESFAENLGTGTLGDGFIGLGEAASLGNSFYQLTVTTPVVMSVPEPSTASMMILALPLLVMFRRRLARWPVKALLV